MNKIINRKAYLHYAKKLKEKELNLINFYRNWLPDTIIDCHSHCNLESHVNFIIDSVYCHMASTFPSFTLEESAEWNGLFHPQKSVLNLRFPLVFKGIDQKMANLYLLNNSPKQDRVALFGLPEDINYTIRGLSHPRVSALKMYYSYLEPPAKEIYQFFPKKVLKAAQSSKTPIVLHLPSRITECLNQVQKLIDDFPNLKICLAHIGQNYSIVAGLEEALATLRQYHLVSLDTALVPSSDVIKVALDVLGAERIMYGSDAPIDLVRSKIYRHPKLGERLATEFPYHWADKNEQKEYGHLASESIHAHWQTLEAIKDAISCFSQTEQKNIKQKIFFENAKLFYGF